MELGAAKIEDAAVGSDEPVTRRRCCFGRRRCGREGWLGECGTREGQGRQRSDHKDSWTKGHDRFGDLQHS